MDAPPPRAPGPPLTRRRFLDRSARLALAAPLLGSAPAVLAACSRPTEPPTIVSLFSPDRVLVAGVEQRIPFGIVAPDAGDAGSVALPPDDGSVDVVIRRDGEVIAETFVTGRVVDHDHVGEPDPDHQHADLFRYYPLRATLPEPGIYDVTVAVGGLESVLPVQAFDPAEVDLPLPGQRFPAPATPTIDDPAGVDRLCTRPEPCPFHRVSADEVVGRGRPLVLLVATPAFCSTAYCGPVLETLIAAAADRTDLDVVHVEVYANPDEVDGNYLDPAIRVAPAVVALGLRFEPSLFVVDGDGVLIDRIDNVFGRHELADALGAVTGA